MRDCLLEHVLHVLVAFETMKSLPVVGVLELMKSTANSAMWTCLAGRAVTLPSRQGCFLNNDIDAGLEAARMPMGMVFTAD